MYSQKNHFSFQVFEFVGWWGFLILYFVAQVKTVSGRRRVEIRIQASQMEAETNALQVKKAFELAVELRKAFNNGNLYDTTTTPKDWLESLSGDKSECVFFHCALWIFKIQRFSIRLFSKLMSLKTIRN